MMFANSTVFTSGPLVSCICKQQEDPDKPHSVLTHQDLQMFDMSLGSLQIYALRYRRLLILCVGFIWPYFVF